MGRMRLALVTTSWPAHDHDPAGHFVRSDAQALERAGHEVVVVSPAAGGAFGWPGAAARIRERPLRAWAASRWIASTRALVSKLKVDRIVAHWAVPSGWPIATGSSVEIDLVSHGGDVRLLVALPKFVRWHLVFLLGARAREWVFASADLLHQLLETLDDRTRRCVERAACVRAPPLDMIDVGADVAHLRRFLGEARIAVCVGRLVPKKRVDRVIEWAARERSIDILVVVGDGPERRSLERLSRARNTQVRFVGAVDRRRALTWIGAADVLVHASEAEGLSCVLREAERLGTSVVRLSAPPGASNDQRSGLR